MPTEETRPSLVDLLADPEGADIDFDPPRFGSLAGSGNDTSHLDVADLPRSAPPTGDETMADLLMVQDMLNGEGFDLEEWIEKAERELVRLAAERNPLYCTDHMINASVTIMSLTDWTYHFEVPGAKPGGETAFADRIGEACPQWQVFRDVANTAKHAQRKKANEHVQKVLMNFQTFDEKLNQIEGVDMARGFWLKMASGKWCFYIPTLRVGGEDHYFSRWAEDVIAWWRSGAWKDVVSAYQA